MISRQFGLFVLTSGVAAAVNVTSRMAFSLAVSYDAAILLAYACGMATAFTLNRTFVFVAAGTEVRGQILRFSLVNLIAIAQVWGVSVTFDRIILPAIGLYWRSETVAHLIGVGSPVLTSYFAHKYFSFAQPAHTRSDSGSSANRM